MNTKEYLNKYADAMNYILEADDPLLELSVKLLNRELFERKDNRLKKVIKEGFKGCCDLRAASVNHDPIVLNSMEEECHNGTVSKT